MIIDFCWIMKIGVYSNCTIDTIILNNQEYEQAGGAACYCGLTSKNLKNDVSLHTNFGNDFPLLEFLLENKIKILGGVTDKPTTRFSLEISGSERSLYLENNCENIEYEQSSYDGIIVSPVFDEISHNVFASLKNDSNFILLDPQGFVRRLDSNNKIFLEKTTLSLENVSAIKVNPDELFCFTNNTAEEGLKDIQSKGVDYVLYTNKREISLLVKDRLYTITLPNIALNDTTGVGDIFSAAFCSTMLKENDFLWALCFAGGAAQAALDSKSIGLSKVPEKNKIETNGSYFYNMVKFRQV